MSSARETPSLPEYRVLRLGGVVDRGRQGGGGLRAGGGGGVVQGDSALGDLSPQRSMVLVPRSVP